MRTRGWTQTELSRALGKPKEQRLRLPLAHGERTPNRDSALLLQKVLRIPLALWSKAPEKPFVPPSARSAALSAALHRAELALQRPGAALACDVDGTLAADVARRHLRPVADPHCLGGVPSERIERYMAPELVALDAPIAGARHRRLPRKW